MIFSFAAAAAIDKVDRSHSSEIYKEGERPADRVVEVNTAGFEVVGPRGGAQGPSQAALNQSSPWPITEP